MHIRAHHKVQIEFVMATQSFPVVARDLYRVDGVISGEFEPIGPAPYEHQMTCFKVKTWQEVLTAEVPSC